MPRDSTDTRARIVTAAGKLFYGHGIRGVSVDDVAARAGVTKRTLYYHFRSKDDLIAAYLSARDEPTIVIVMGWMDAAEGTLAEKLEAVFAQLARLGRSPKWRGCGFLRTAAELVTTPGHPALKAGSAHKKKLEAEFAARFAAAGLDDAALRARQVMLLFDGAFSAMLTHRDPSYAEAAGQAAMALVRDEKVRVKRRA
ncbi:MAG: helix-turn-helix domain-containing protein [Pseudolabrys sp.]|nr:helix-turn-helix domain-containing protein [Pseudolabrys sp.]MDP2298513.1 helix-turn-helix domain-containing protein [Pseudolabrys sp.]